jgi:hypothetical protein
MVPLRKRLLYSLFSVILVGCIVGSILAVWANASEANNDGWFSGGFSTTVAVFGLIGFCIAGWIVMLPLVLAIADFRGRRFWVLLAAGTLAGPFLAVAVRFWLWQSRTHPWVGLLNLEGLGYLLLFAGVSGTITLLYLLFVRNVQRAQPAVSEFHEVKSA